MLEIYLVVTTMEKNRAVGYRKKVVLPAVPQKENYLFGNGFGGNVKDIMYHVTKSEVFVMVHDEAIDYESFRREEWESCDPELPFNAFEKG